MRKGEGHGGRSEMDVSSEDMASGVFDRRKDLNSTLFREVVGTRAADVGRMGGPADQQRVGHAKSN